MAVTLNIQLTDEQQALMVAISNQVLPEGHKVADKLAWATQVASDGLAAEVQRLGLAEIETDAREAQNVARRDFIAQVEAAWPEPEPEPVPEGV